MPQLNEKTYTAEDYWNLPNDTHAELIDGELIMMAPPSPIHQEITLAIATEIRNYIRKKAGDCKVYPSPFAVNLTANDETWIEPDISIICDKSKITDRGCTGAPDFIVEIVSPSSSKMDYSTKMILYSNSGVREYWIVDPEKERTTIYRFEEDAAPTIIPFNHSIAVGIYEDLSITIADLLK